jgi:hypothetical protein
MSLPHSGPPDAHGLTPEQAAWLRDPRHPVHNGLRLHPVPNLIVTRTGRPQFGERGLRMSRWMRRTVVWAHYSGLQKFLLWAGLVVLVLVLLCAPLLLGPLDCVSEGGRAVCSTR